MRIHTFDVTRYAFWMNGVFKRRTIWQFICPGKMLTTTHRLGTRRYVLIDENIKFLVFCMSNCIVRLRKNVFLFNSKPYTPALVQNSALILENVLLETTVKLININHFKVLMYSCYMTPMSHHISEIMYSLSILLHLASVLITYNIRQY